MRFARGAAAIEWPTLAAVSAQKFRQSVCVNTRSGYQAAWESSWVQGFKDALSYLGAGGVRDGLHGPDASYHPPQRQFFRDIAGSGYRITMGMGGLDFRQQMPSKLWELMGDPNITRGVTAIESVNEPDLYTTGEHCPNATDGWWTCVRWYQEDLYTRVKGAPQLAHIPVVGPSFIGLGGRQQVGWLDPWADIGNVHPYPGGGMPGVAAQQGLADAYLTTSAFKPVHATEVGYHTGYLIQGHDGVPPRVRASYTVRLLLEHFRLGYERSDLWTLIEYGGESPHVHDFGLFEPDTFAPRHAARAIRNLTQTVGNGNPPMVPVKLALEGPPDMRRLILQNDQGYVVALWRDVSIWDRGTRTEITVAPVAVKVSSPGTVTAVRPVDSATASPVATTVDLAGDPVLLKVVP